MVFKGSNQSAIKVHNERAGFDRELAAYGRLQHFKVTEIAGLAVPSLMGFESELKIIEISIVSPPYLLDFGGAHLDEAPSHIIDSDAKQRWMEERLEKFAESTPLVNRALAELERKYGVFLTDIHPGNIRIV